MTVSQRRAPPASAFIADLGKFYHWDAFEAPLARTGLAMHEIYLAIFAHHPWWAKLLLLVRTKIVALFGIKGPTAAELYNVEIKTSYLVGEKIGQFTLFAQNKNELIAGGDNKHLDFRVALSKLNEGGENKVVLATVVTPHNRFGKVYLFLILPFHRFGVRTILSNAVAARRM